MIDRITPNVSNDHFRTFKGNVVVRFDCATHGFAGWNLSGTHVSCRFCSRRLFGPVVDLIFTDMDDLTALGG